MTQQTSLNRGCSFRRDDRGCSMVYVPPLHAVSHWIRASLADGVTWAGASAPALRHACQSQCTDAPFAFLWESGLATNMLPHRTNFLLVSPLGFHMERLLVPGDM